MPTRKPTRSTTNETSQPKPGSKGSGGKGGRSAAKRSAAKTRSVAAETTDTAADASSGPAKADLSAKNVADVGKALGVSADRARRAIELSHAAETQWNIPKDEIAKLLNGPQKEQALAARLFSAVTSDPQTRSAIERIAKAKNVSPNDIAHQVILNPTSLQKDIDALLASDQTAAAASEGAAKAATADESAAQAPKAEEVVSNIPANRNERAPSGENDTLPEPDADEEGGEAEGEDAEPEPPFEVSPEQAAAYLGASGQDHLGHLQTFKITPKEVSYSFHKDGKGRDILVARDANGEVVSTTRVDDATQTQSQQESQGDDSGQSQGAQPTPGPHPIFGNANPPLGWNAIPKAAGAIAGHFKKNWPSYALYAGGPIGIGAGAAGTRAIIRALGSQAQPQPQQPRPEEDYSGYDMGIIPGLTPKVADPNQQPPR